MINNKIPRRQSFWWFIANFQQRLVNLRGTRFIITRLGGWQENSSLHRPDVFNTEYLSVGWNCTVILRRLIKSQILLFCFENKKKNVLIKGRERLNEKKNWFAKMSISVTQSTLTAAEVVSDNNYGLDPYKRKSALTFHGSPELLRINLLHFRK